jgi:hypothetical protein
MAYLPLRGVEVAASAARLYDEWLAALDAELAAPGADWYRIARDVLFEIWYPGHADYPGMVADAKLPAASPSRSSAWIRTTSRSSPSTTVRSTRRALPG